MYKIYGISILVLLLFSTSHAQQARLVKDITPGTSGSFSFDFYPDEDGLKIAFDDYILFVTRNSGNYDLWISDGQEEGTQLLLDNVDRFYDFMDGQDGNIYFSYRTSDGMFQLYALQKTDLLLKLLYTSEGPVKALTMLNAQLYAAIRHDLVRINPATTDTEVIRSFNSFYTIHDLHTLGDRLIIAGGDDGENGLLVSDGTAAGTQAYYSFNGAQNYNGDYFMTVVGDQLFFFSNSAEHSFALYRTDGTEAGTQVVRPFERINFYDLEARRSIIAWNNKLFFQAKEPDADFGQHKFYVSDGTTEGTFTLNVSEFTEYPAPSDFTIYHDELYFVAAETDYIYTVYKTDGTQAGTIRAIDRNALGTGLSLGGQFLTVHQDSLYFTGYRSAVGEELWVSGGSTETTRVIDLVPGASNSTPSQMTSTGDQLFFTYRSPDYGKEVFVLESDISSTTQVAKHELQVFPNPLSGDELQLNLPPALQHQSTNVSLIDMLGRSYPRSLSANGHLNMGGLPTGVFVITVSAENNVYIGKVIRL